MRNILAIAAAASALATAAPAAAWYGGRHFGAQHELSNSVNQHQAEIRQRIRFELRRGFLSPREADRLLVALRATQRLETRYRRNGLSFAEARDLHRRLDRLERRVIAEARDGNRWYG